MTLTEIATELGYRSAHNQEGGYVDNAEIAAVEVSKLTRYRHRVMTAFYNARTEKLIEIRNRKLASKESA